jgi:cytoskeletal protein CcmA (bactofilin family)
MFFKKSNRIQNSIDTLIGAETRIEGNINFSGGLRVDGAIRGNVTEPNASPSTLILSEFGRIEGAVNASKIVINGRVIGPVRAGQFIELQAKAHITGDVYYKSQEMHTGAVIEGKLVYLGENSQELEVGAN